VTNQAAGGAADLRNFPNDGMLELWSIFYFLAQNVKIRCGQNGYVRLQLSRIRQAYHM
jgi:hypothetical protein